MPPPETQPNLSIWVLTDEVVGHANQSLGVAEALGLPFAAHALRYSPWAALPGALGAGSLFGLTAASRASLTSPWPDLVIATGRRLGAVARWIKRRAAIDGRKTRLVQIMDPVQGRDTFDLIAAPRHDRMAPRANLFETIGAPHRITPARLAAEAERWQPVLVGLPRPRIAVLVGGATRRRGFAPALAAELGRLASNLAVAHGGSLLITTSRRTGAAATDALLRAVTAPSYVHRWDAAEKKDGTPEGNPYFAFLALSDAVIVTGESISMCSEACAAGKPVYIYAPPAIVKPAFARLHADLYRAGLARPLNQETSAAFDPSPRTSLSVADDIAGEIRRRFAL
jgi:mitochondrial fission protein ELM1